MKQYIIIMSGYVPLYQWWVAPLDGQTLAEDPHTSFVLLSRQVCSQSFPAEPKSKRIQGTLKKKKN